METSIENTYSCVIQKLVNFHFLTNLLKLSLGLGILICFSFHPNDIVLLIQIWALIFLSLQLLMKYFEEKNLLRNKLENKIKVIIIIMYGLSVCFTIVPIESICYFLGIVPSIMMIIICLYELICHNSQIHDLFQRGSPRKNYKIDVVEKISSDVQGITEE